MQKKASLELSINAIVILVLAITMLGLGLGFTKGMFGQLKSQLVVPPPEIPATSDDPVVLPTGGQLNLKAAKDTTFVVNFFNNVETATFIPDVVCNPSIASDKIAVSSQKVAAQTYKGFQVILKADAFAASATNICTVTFCKQSDVGCATDSASLVESKQIIINAQ